MINLPADLPEDWNPTQYISPGGTEVGLTKQHGYNYLMKQVNNIQRYIKWDSIAAPLFPIPENDPQSSYTLYEIRGGMPDVITMDTVFRDAVLDEVPSRVVIDLAGETVVYSTSKYAGMDFQVERYRGSGSYIAVSGDVGLLLVRNGELSDVPIFVIPETDYRYMYKLFEIEGGMPDVITMDTVFEDAKLKRVRFDWDIDPKIGTMIYSENRFFGKGFKLTKYSDEGSYIATSGDVGLFLMRR